MMASYHTETPETVYISSAHHINPIVEIEKVRDWLPWSVVNIFVGWGIGGLLPLIFTLLCRNDKQRNDLQGARTMSTLSLVFNIIITLTGIAGWICLIVLLVNARRLYDMYYTNYSY
ncbi:hypothetical protein I4U23_023629 [Adineta vaga]|nr:hypothetical protein I4U23_023629 [Adineta vaga]